MGKEIELRTVIILAALAIAAPASAQSLDNISRSLTSAERISNIVSRDQCRSTTGLAQASCQMSRLTSVSHYGSQLQPRQQSKSSTDMRVLARACGRGDKRACAILEKI